MNIPRKMREMYEFWLLDTYSDEISTNEQLMEYVRIGQHYEEFEKAIKEALHNLCEE